MFLKESLNYRAGLRSFEEAVCMSTGTIVPEVFDMQFSMVVKDSAFRPAQQDPCDLVCIFSMYKQMKRD